VQARRVRQDTGPTDRRRLAAAGLSAILPGLGQAFNQRQRLSTWFVVPSLILLVAVLIVLRTQSLTQLAAWAIQPSVLGILLSLNLLILAWRLLAVGQAFLDTTRPGPTGRLGVFGIILIALVVAAPHLVAWRYATIVGDTFSHIFGGQVLTAEGGPQTSSPPAPTETERINVLLIGVDATKSRTEVLTDTMMVVSLDPVGHTISMVSVPRDIVNTPLGDGNRFGPKLNSLMTYANTHADIFPAGGYTTLEHAVGALLGIRIDYYARMDFAGFITMIDAVGGVDIKVARDLSDPGYDGKGLGEHGFSVTKGMHHFDGAEALAYARIRKAVGESDFTRADRQQQVLVALKAKVMEGGNLLFKLPDLLEAVGSTVTTDLPESRLTDLAAIMDEVGDKGVTRAVIDHPLVATKNTRYGSSLVPNLKAIQAMAAALFSPPGVAPIPWPTPIPTATPKATAVP
jgi:polyisoprenyl-teichoic acid--peptidoglycan teichoic acid transferase